MKQLWVNSYRCYDIYRVVTDTGDVIFNGISDYVKDGFITVTGKTQQEVVLGINNVYKRMQLININKKMKRR